MPKATAALLGALLLGSCGPGRDPVGTPVAWWHQLQGGAIAEQRPPPPGVDAPYPLIGTTPSRPTVTSAAARDALTASLIDQQDASHRLDTRDPIIVTAASNTMGLKQTTPALSTSPVPSMATLDAAGTSAPPAASGAPVPQTKPAVTPEQQEANEPVLAMPPPPPGTTIIAAGPLPQMPVRPPAPPSFPGFDVPATPLPPIHPDFSAMAASLSNLAFQSGSDVLLPADRAALRRIASSRGAAPVKVDGFGDALADTPDQQAAALRLGLARAASAAAALEQLGVPQASLQVAASAFGRGGSVAVVH